MRMDLSRTSVMGSTCGYSGEQKETELTLKVSTYRIEKMELKAFINSEREDSILRTHARFS